MWLRRSKGTISPADVSFWVPGQMTSSQAKWCSARPALRSIRQVCAATGCGHRRSVCLSPQRRKAERSSLTRMLSSKACAMWEEVPVALAMSSATGPLPPVIHPQPPCCHQHPAPGGRRLDCRVVARAWRRPRGGVVGSDLISSQLIRGSSLGCCILAQSSSPHHQKQLWEDMGGADLTSTAWPHCP